MHLRSRAQRLASAVLILLVLLALTAPAAWALGPENVLILANRDDPGSIEIAEHYAKRRRIEVSRILKLKTSKEEEIDRTEFMEQIYEPVHRAVMADPRICIIVPTRGVPLKVKDRTRDDNEGAFKGHDEASVDGELTLARGESLSIDGAIKNDLLNSKSRITTSSKYLVVARLDGPTVETVKGMIDKAILAETLGVAGRSFLDTRGDTLKDGYLERDRLMRQVAATWAAAGMPYDHDTEPEVVDLSTRDETLHYYGWYAGNQKPAGTVRFRTGGICVHLHSFAAATVRVPSRNWVGPLLAWNATATYGTVYEPYTVGFPYEHIFWDRICRGWSFGEAGLVSNGLLSWQAVFCGDPLYTPYAPGHAELNQRYRECVAHVLAPAADGEAPDPSGLLLLDNVVDILKTYEEGIRDVLSAEPATALMLFNHARFAVQDMGLQAWVRKLAEPFERALKESLARMKQAVQADLTDTKELEDALEDWADLPVYNDLVALRDELARDQERAATRQLRRAQSDHKASRWLGAWTNAAEVAAHRLVPELAAQGQAILDDIKGDADVWKDLLNQAEKALAPAVERATKEMERGRADRAAKALGTQWKWFPECEQRNEAAALAKKIAQAQAGGG